VAEFIRRRPEPDAGVTGRARMPEVWDELAADELRMILAESRRAAEGVLDLAHDLAARLPGTMAAFRAGTLSRYKVAVIAAAAALLDPAEARAAEALVLGRAAAAGRAAREAAVRAGRVRPGRVVPRRAWSRPGSPAG